MIDAAIVGAGPYGLSLGAYLRQGGVQFRIFGRLMDSWTSHMPKGMQLKSEGFASNLYGLDRQFTLKDFCAQKGIEYQDVGLPVRLDTFCAYGAAFKERMVPELENKMVTHVSRSAEGFALKLDDGETLVARNVILAVGITHFAYVPPCLADLPAEFGSHSSAHHDLEPFKGKRVAVIGAGASASDVAGLLHEAGADVELIVRGSKLDFHTRGSSKRGLWQRIRYPKSGLGPGLKSRFFSNWPNIVHYLPESYRMHAVRTHLGPAGGWFAKDMIIGRVAVLFGHTPENATVKDGRVQLRLRKQDGGCSEILVDHVISATGYQVDVDRLPFLDDTLRSGIKLTGRAPKLSSSFESSIPGLYFVGVSAANSFGPLMRFAYGARFAAERVTAELTREFSGRRAVAAVPDIVTSLK
jgi:thioredoxin reductase